MTSAEDLRRVALLAAFRMPSVQTMVSRKSSITNAFVCAIIPVVPPTHEEIEQALSILQMSPDDVRCAYCGDISTEWDHLRPLVVGLRPTGFISEIANLVPACGKCNQSKGNKEWRIWILNTKAKRSPAGRGVADIQRRFGLLEAFEQWRSPTHIDFESIIGRDAWANYWSLWENVISELKECQSVANEFRAKILQSLRKSV